MSASGHRRRSGQCRLPFKSPWVAVQALAKTRRYGLMTSMSHPSFSMNLTAARARRRFMRIGARLSLATIASIPALSRQNPAAASPAPAEPAPSDWSQQSVPSLFEQADIVLLGEVHDNPAHHRLRMQWLDALARRKRFVLAMEQFDVEHQQAIDAARRQGLSARALAQQAGFSFSGWQWSFYEPFVELALVRDLPLRAANLSRQEARRVAADNPAWTLPAGWDEAEEERLARIIAAGHCGLLPERALAPMAAAQRARDRCMAQTLMQARSQTGLPVVLLAGNMHVRKDLGVARWLKGLGCTDRVLSLGLLEDAQDSSGQAQQAYDRVLVTGGVTDRDDPCRSLRKAPDAVPAKAQDGARGAGSAAPLSSGVGHRARQRFAQYEDPVASVGVGGV